MKVFLLFLLFQQTHGIDEERAQLERLKREFEEGKRKIAKMEIKVKGTEEELKSIERKEREVRGFVNKLNRDINTIQNELSKLEIQIDQKEKELGQHGDRIKFSLNFLYQTLPENEILRFLPGEGDKEALFLLDYAIQNEKRERDMVLKIYSELNAYKKLKQDNLDFVLAMKDEVIAQERNLQDLKRQKQNLLAGLKRQKSAEERRLAELEAAIKEMQALIARLEKEQEKKRKEERIEAKSPVGKYPWPVKGRVVMNYGTIVNPKYNTKIFNPGIEIETDPGSPVLCIEDGVVIFAGVVTGYGNTVVVDHGGFFSVYSYLNSFKIAKGSKVNKGQVLGDVGGETHYFGSRLHFEIREQGKAINPLLYLD
ncbi:MAG: peptidoglycan DD-metalloendopeptidase family protein [Candidatus Hydrothermia bacterium]